MPEKTNEVVGKHDGDLAFVLDPRPQRRQVDWVAGVGRVAEQAELAGQEPHSLAHVLRGQALVETVEEFPHPPLLIESNLLPHDSTGRVQHDLRFGLGVEGDLDAQRSDSSDVTVPADHLADDGVTWFSKVDRGAPQFEAHAGELVRVGRAGVDHQPLQQSRHLARVRPSQAVGDRRHRPRLVGSRQ